MWWLNAWPVWKDYKGAEKLAIKQRIRKIVYTLVIVISLSWGGKRAWERGAIAATAVRAQHLAASLVVMGHAVKDRLLAMASHGA